MKGVWLNSFGITKVVEKIKTHFMFSNPPPNPEIHTVYEEMWKNMIQPDRPHDNIIGCTKYAICMLGN
jgi:hypothetical protein